MDENKQMFMLAWLVTFHADHALRNPLVISWAAVLRSQPEDMPRSRKHPIAEQPEPRQVWRERFSWC
jgi:hypothetical protein